MPFERFSRKSAGKSTEPFVTIQRRGTFSMNSAAAKLLSGGEPFDKLPVELFYDREEKAVGLQKASSGGGPDVYYMRKQPSSESYILSGQAFTQHYGIDTTISRRYRATMRDGLLTFRLTDKHIEVMRTGRPAKGEFAGDPEDEIEAEPEGT